MRDWGASAKLECDRSGPSTAMPIHRYNETEMQEFAQASRGEGIEAGI